MRRPLLAIAAAAAVLPAVPADAGGGCHQSPAEGSVTEVATVEACFDPAVNRVATGTTVTWFNKDGIEHNLTGPAEVFGTHELKPAATVRITFAKAGTYPYACTLHYGMTGVVVVGGGAAPVAAPSEAAPQPVTLTAAEETWTDSAAAVGGAGAGVLGLGLAAGFAVGRRRTAA